MAPEDCPQLRRWDVSSLWRSAKELLSHSNFGGIATKGTNVFLDPPQGLSLYKERVRLFLSYGRLGVGVKHSRSWSPRLPTPAALTSFPPKKPNAGTLFSDHTYPSLLENSPESLVQQRV